jgi:hypothetical protein
VLATRPGGTGTPLATTELGILQLLFDFILLSQILAPRDSLAISTFSEAPALVSHREGAPASKALEGALSGALDPIDWATYEPQLRRLATQCLQQRCLLLGLLLPALPELKVRSLFGSHVKVLLGLVPPNVLS